MNDAEMTDALTGGEENSPDKLMMSREVNKTLTEMASKLSPQLSNMSSAINVQIPRSI